MMQHTLRRLAQSALLSGWLGGFAFAQSTFYSTGQLQRIELQFSQADWDYRMDTAKAGAETYLMADYVRINGIQYDSVGVKYKGNSSYNASQVKNPLNIALDEFIGQSHEGFTTLKLSNCYADPSMIREVLAYDALRNYMHCPRSNFAQVYINGAYIGLYSNTENIDKDFVGSHFYSFAGTFFKCNPIGIPSPTTKSNLKTIAGADSTGYFPRYELKSNTGWNDLVDLCDVVTNQPAQVAGSMDMDRAIWMLAFNDVMVNLDSYTGVFAQNYYLYRDGQGLFNPIMWDLNMCFGGFPFMGVGATGTATLTVPDMEVMPIDVHGTDPNWPLINAVMSQPRYLRMYLAHLRTITDEVIASGAYIGTATVLQATIDTAVASDNNKFYTYTEFQNGLTASAPNGSYTVPGISSLMGARLAYLQSTPQFAYVQPSIGSPVASPSAPALNAAVTITAAVTNADSVFLGYRLDQAEHFQRIPMLDDGAHGDGAAGDGNYGAAFTLSSAAAQYYVYAENVNIGAFSPARAEHEFHTLTATLSLPAPGDLVINEFLAVNQTGQMDEAGQLEDWIELRNNTNQTLALTGLYLTDNATQRNKYAFPAGTVMPPQSLLMIWADGDTTTPNYLHCNFKLSSGGEVIILGDGGAYTIDSVAFGPQVADVSVGRCPDGQGSFAAQAIPTFNALNCGLGTDDVAEDAHFQLYPNPANDAVTLAVDHAVRGEVVVLNALGQQVWSEKWVGNTDLDLRSWQNGIYFVRLGNATRKLVVTH